jgi:hypothetical protein
MEITVVAVVALLGFGLFFFVLKRLLRMAIRLALFGAILVGLLVAALAWWWYAPLGQTPANRNASGGASRPARTPR